jgi:hypothetical protein
LVSRSTPAQYQYSAAQVSVYLLGCYRVSTGVRIDVALDSSGQIYRRSVHTHAPQRKFTPRLLVATSKANTGVLAQKRFLPIPQLL